MDGKLIFEGEYLNDKRNGKGKEYYIKGELKFEGEYLNGKRNGKGKEYYKNGKLIFEGEYLDDSVWNGKYEEYDGNLKILEAIYQKGKKIIKYQYQKFSRSDVHRVHWLP